MLLECEPQNYLLLFIVVGLEGLGQLKYSMASGIESANLTDLLGNKSAAGA
jgi:hypothetical protein